MHVHVIKKITNPIIVACLLRGKGVDFQAQYHQFVTSLLTQWRLVVERTPKSELAKA
jgi:hypothetical protein